MRIGVFLRRPLLGAFILSILLHMSVVGYEVLQELLWTPDHEETELRSTKKKLKSQSLDDPIELALQKVKPAETLTIYLPPIAKGSGGQKKDAAPAKPKKKVRKAIPAKKPEVIASTPAGDPDVPPVKIAASQPQAEPVTEVASAPAQVVIASAVQASQPAEAKTPGFSGLARFPRNVKMTYRWGIYVADLEWKVANGKYDVEVEGSGLGAFYRYFHSQGRIDHDGVWPDHFIEFRERSKTKPEFQLDFDYGARTVEVGEPGKRKIEPMGEGDKDVFSTAFHLALMGSAQDEYVLNIYTGRRRYEAVKFKVAGEAKLMFGTQEVEVILLRGHWQDRRFDFWLAPQWNNLPVRINVVVPDKASGDLWVQDVTIDGKKVLEWNPPQQD